MLTNNGDYSRNVSSFVYEFKDSASFALILAAQIHQQKGIFKKLKSFEHFFKIKDKSTALPNASKCH